MDEDLKKLILLCPELQKEVYSNFQALLYIWLNVDTNGVFTIHSKKFCRTLNWLKSELNFFLSQLSKNGAEIQKITDEKDTILIIRIPNPYDNIFKYTIAEKILLPFSEPEFEFFWKRWIDHRKRKGVKKYEAKGLQRAFKKLVTLSDGNLKSACEHIEYAIDNGWQGFYPIPKKYGQQQGQSSLNDYKNKLLNDLQTRGNTGSQF
jgi:hypothetical protein